MKVSFILLNFLFFANVVLSQNSETTKKNNRAIKSEVQNILNTPSCLELVHYRDKELYQQYVKAFNEYTNKYKLDKQAIIDLQKNREDLLKGDASWWQMSTKTATTDAGLATALIAKNIQISCKLISNLLKFNPAVGIAHNAVEEGVLAVDRIYEGIEAGEKIHYLVNEGVEKAAYQEVLSIAGPLGQAVKTAWDLSEGISEMTEMPENRDKLKEEVTRILDMIDVQAKKYQKNIDLISGNLSNINEIKKGIDKYLARKCKYVSPEKNLPENKKTFIIEDSKKSNVVKQEKSVSGASYYVFFTTQIYIDNKLTDIISKPIPYDGKPNDISTDDQDHFIDQIKLQIPNQEDLKKEELRNYIKVHYGKPFSTLLLKSNNDVYEAIDAYKKSMFEAVQGIGEVNFLQLK